MAQFNIGTIGYGIFYTGPGPAVSHGDSRKHCSFKELASRDHRPGDLGLNNSRLWLDDAECGG